METYDPQSIANFFIDCGAREGRFLRAPQLMALVYIAHGWYLGLTSKPLINKAPQAWEIGPVIPTLYEALKIYGYEPIRDKISKASASQATESMPTREVYALPNDPKIVEFLHGVWKAYGSFSDSELLTLTKKEGTPWQVTWTAEGAKYSKGVDIPEQLIQTHYQTLNTDVLAPGIAAAASG